MYNKIYKGMLFLCLIVLSATLTVVLGAVYVILSVSLAPQSPVMPFLYVAGFALFFSLILFIICITISHKLTKNILNPITNFKLSDPTDNDDDIYPELRAMIKKITAQDSEIKRQVAKLQTRKTSFQLISENISEGLLTLDHEGSILSANQNISKIFGIDYEDIAGKKLSVILAEPEICNKLDAAYLGKKEFAVISLGGMNYNMFFSPVFDGDSVCGMVVLILDVSEKAHAEKIRQEFTANVSHELKTPLTTILGYSQIINQGIAKTEDISRFSEKIEKEATRLIALIDDIMKLSRLDEQSPTFEAQQIHMLSIAKEVVEDLSLAAQKKNVSIDISGTDFIINGNLQQITELVYNLCDNAIKYNIDGGYVKIYLNNSTISFSDSGIGIAPEYHDRIFERFFRVDKSRSKSVNGTGLGLSIVKHIAEHHNAEIFVESKPGEGTRIRVVF